jgi:hypothetical protein
MRAFASGCLVWFIVYPLSVTVAALVLSPPLAFIASLQNNLPFDLEQVAALAAIAGAVTFFWAAIPAFVMRRELRFQAGVIGRYINTGLVTGLVGALVVVLGTPVSFLFSGSLATRTLGTIEAAQSLASLWLFALALFALAGATGAAVFGGLCSWVDAAIPQVLAARPPPPRLNLSIRS